MISEKTLWIPNNKTKTKNDNNNENHQQQQNEQRKTQQQRKQQQKAKRAAKKQNPKQKTQSPYKKEKCKIIDIRKNLSQSKNKKNNNNNFFFCRTSQSWSWSAVPLSEAWLTTSIPFICLCSHRGCKRSLGIPSLQASIFIFFEFFFNTFCAF